MKKLISLFLILSLLLCGCTTTAPVETAATFFNDTTVPYDTSKNILSPTFGISFSSHT